MAPEKKIRELLNRIGFALAGENIGNRVARLEAALAHQELLAIFDQGCALDPSDASHPFRSEIFGCSQDSGRGLDFSEYSDEKRSAADAAARIAGAIPLASDIPGVDC